MESEEFETAFWKVRNAQVSKNEKVNVHVVFPNGTIECNSYIMSSWDFVSLYSEFSEFAIITKTDAIVKVE